MIRIIIYYHPHIKKLNWQRLTPWLEDHIRKFGRFNTETRQPVVIKEQNTLILEVPSDNMYTEISNLLDTLNKAYNDSTHNLANLNRENFPELYI